MSDNDIILMFRDVILNDAGMTVAFKASIEGAIRDYHNGLPFEDDRKLANAIFNRIFDVDEGL